MTAVVLERRTLPRRSLWVAGVAVLTAALVSLLWPDQATPPATAPDLDEAAMTTMELALPVGSALGPWARASLNVRGSQFDPKLVPGTISMAEAIDGFGRGEGHVVAAQLGLLTDKMCKPDGRGHCRRLYVGHPVWVVEIAGFTWHPPSCGPIGGECPVGEEGAGHAWWAVDARTGKGMFGSTGSG